MKLGDSASTRRRFNETELAEYTALCGRAGEGVPEPLIGSLFSYLLGVELPGPGTNYLKQDTVFHATAQVGEKLAAEVRVTRLRPEKCLVDLETTCTGSGGRPIASGRALVYVADTRAG
jgi:hypothetical protein